MALLSNERVTWLRKHQRVNYGVFAFFWGFVFMLLFLVPQRLENGLVQKYPQGTTANIAVHQVMLIPSLLQRQMFEFDTHITDLLERSGRWTPSNPDIVLLGADNASNQLDMLDPQVVEKDPVLSKMKKGWPWSREVHAAILDRLIQAGAKVVIFDILFTSAKEEDAAFKAAIDRAGDRVVLGCNIVDFGKVQQFPSETLLDDPVHDPRIALVNFPQDAHGNVIRQVAFATPYIGSSIGRVSSDVIINAISARAAKLVGKGDLVPKDEENHWFRFTGLPRESFKTESVYKIFNPVDWQNLFQDGAYFKDKIVMIGPLGNFMQDSHSTPMGGMDGAEVHLHALNAVLQGELLTYAGDRPEWVVALVAIAGMLAWLLGFTVQRITLRRVLTAMVLAVILTAGYYYFSRYLYAQGIILAFAAPLGTFGFTLISGLGGQYLLEQMERARTRRSFERYVSAKIVREILDNPAGYNDALSGRRRQVTVLFSDLRGFTSMTENADSEKLVRELNEYLQEMTRALFKHEGILDKFIGDAVMAMWGSFQPHPAQDARNAVLAALAMHEALAQLNVRRRERGLKDFAMGVGINHGEAIVGDIGSEQQMNFTVIGDSVNLASRLEGTTKEYGVGTLISEAVEELVRPHFHLQTVDSIVVKGKTKPVMTFTVLGEKSVPLPTVQAAYLERFEEAMRFYRAQKFTEARDGFAACRVMFPEDKLSRIFEERSAEFMAESPPQPWDGSYTMKTK